MKTVSRRSLNLAAVLAFLASACGIAPNNIASAGKELSLDGEWILSGIRSAGQSGWSEHIAKALISFEGGKVSGYSGCNRFFGSYLVNGRGLSFGPLAGTKRACLGSANGLESAFMGNLSKVAAFQIEEDRLRLLDAQNTTLLTFKRKQPLALLNTDWSIIFYRRPNAIQSVVNNSNPFIKFGDGTFSGNSGCNMFSGRFGQNAEFLKLTDLVFTEIGCNPDLMDQERFIFEDLAKVRRWKDDGRTLWLQDSEGANLLQLVQSKV